MFNEDLTAHLTAEELKELIERYYKKERCSDLIKEFKIDCRPSGLSNIFPPTETDDPCPYCENSNLHIRYGSRYLPKEKRKVLYCPECLHHKIEKCGCTNCIEKYKSDKLKKVIELLKIPSERINYNSIDDLSKFYLHILVSEENINGSLIINSLNNFSQSLAPTDQMETYIMDYLCNRQVLVPDPYSCLDLVEEHPFQDTVYSFDKRNAQWLINVYQEGVNDSEMILLLKNNQDFQVSNKYELMNQIRIEECVEGLIAKILRFFDREYRPSKRCYEVFEKGLETYSINQIFYFIHIRVNSISGQWRTTDRFKNLSHVFNALIQSIEFYMQKAKEENWTFTTYGRPASLPKSLISYYFFKYIVPIGEDSFMQLIADSESIG